MLDAGGDDMAPLPQLGVLGTHVSGIFTFGGANSLDIRFGILAVALEADPRQDDGSRAALVRTLAAHR